MGKLLVLLTFLSLTACSNSSSSPTPAPNPFIPSQAQCLSINTLTAQSPDFLFEIADGTVYQISYRSIIMLEGPGGTNPPGTIVTGTITWYQCQVQTNQGTVLS